MDKAKVKPEVE